MVPFIKRPNVDYSEVYGIMKLREYLENNYNTELHDIYDLIADDAQTNDSQIDGYMDNISELESVKNELTEMKTEIDALIKDKKLLDYDEFVEELERIQL